MLYLNIAIIIVAVVAVLLLIKYKYIKFNDLVDIVVAKLEKYYLYEAGSTKTKLAVTLIREQINKIWVLSWVTDDMIISLIKKAVDKYQAINGTTSSRKEIAKKIITNFKASISDDIKSTLLKNNVNSIIADQVVNVITDNKAVKEASKSIIIQASTDFKKNNVLGLGINWKF